MFPNSLGFSVLPFPCVNILWVDPTELVAEVSINGEMGGQFVWVKGLEVCCPATMMEW